MDFFGNQPDDDDFIRYRGNSKILKFILKAIGILFGFPAWIIGVIHFYGLFAYGRLRVSVLTIISVVELLILVPIVYSMHPFKTIVESFSFTDGVNLRPMFISYVGICIILGIIGAYGLSVWRASQFRINPSLLFMDGWSYRFKYRKTPWELIKKNRLKLNLENGKYYNEEYSPIGVLESPIAYQVEEIDESKASIEKLDLQVVKRTYANAKKQTIVTGETGSGKTVTMLSLIYNDIKNGYPVCMIDMKKSPDVLYFLSKWAKEHGRDFYYFSNGDDRDPDNPFYGDKATYDPFSSGEQSGRADVILALRKWDTAADVYKARTESLLNALFFALINVDKNDCPNISWGEGGLAEIISALNLPNMYDLINGMRKKGNLAPVDVKRINTLEEIYKSLVDKTPEGKNLKEQLDGIKLICNKLITSSYGTWLSKGSSTKHIDLLKTSTDKNGPVVLFSLSPQEEAEFARSMGEIILSDLKRASNKKNSFSDDTLFGVYIDEFQSISIEHVSDLLEKSRSAGFFCTLSSQSLEQISSRADGDGEAKLKGLLDTCGNYIFHSGAKEESAERMAGILGKSRHLVRRASVKNDGGLFKANFNNQKRSQMMKSSEEDWVMSPSNFMSLSRPSKENGYKSEAIVISTVSSPKMKRGGVFGAQRTHVIAQNEITAGISHEFKEYIAKNAVLSHKKLTGEDLSYLMDNLDELDTIPTVISPNSETISDSNDLDEAFIIRDKKANQQIEEDDWGIDFTDGSLEDSNTFDNLHEDILDSAIPEVTENKVIPKLNIQTERKLTTFEKRKLENKNPKETPTKEIVKKEENVQKKSIPTFKLPDL